MTDDPNDTPPPMDDEGADSSPTSESPESPESPQETLQESPPLAEAASSTPPAAAALGQGKLQESEEKTMGMLAHILGGLTCVLGPLIIWLIKKEESPFIEDQGKEALNFQISVLIGYVVLLVLTQIPFVGCVAFLCYFALAIGSLILAIIGGLAANKGQAYRYPFALRLIS